MAHQDSRSHREHGRPEEPNPTAEEHRHSSDTQRRDQRKSRPPVRIGRLDAVARRSDPALSEQCYSDGERQPGVPVHGDAR